MALVIPAPQAAGIALPVLCAMDIAGLRAWWGKWSVQELRAILPGGLLGIALGTAVFGLMSDQAVKLMVGLIALVFLARSLWQARPGRTAPPPAPSSPRRGGFWGAVSGLTSTIAHAGYLMMGVAAAIAMAGVTASGTRDAVSAVAFYLGTYVFMNLGAFAIVALLRNTLRSEEIASYAGLVRTSPGIVVAMAVVLVSLIGLPPLAGFVAKFLVFSSIVEAITAGAERPLLLVLLVIGGLNTVISLFYYLRVLKVMTFDPPPDERASEPFSLVSLPGAVVTAFVLPVVGFGLFWSGLYAAAQLAGAFAS
jgi:hypothetical protein